MQLGIGHRQHGILPACSQHHNLKKQGNKGTTSKKDCQWKTEVRNKERKKGQTSLEGAAREAETLQEQMKDMTACHLSKQNGFVGSRNLNTAKIPTEALCSEY